MRVRWGRHIIRSGFFLLFLVILARMVEPHLVREALSQVRPGTLLLALVLAFLCIAVRAYRWEVILNQGEKRLSFKDAFLITLIGIALNMFIPATLGDIAKAYYGYKIYGIKEESLSTSLIDKLFALCALFFIGAFSAYFLSYYVLCGVALAIALLLASLISLPARLPWKIVSRLFEMCKKSVDVEKFLTACTLPLSLKAAVMLLSLGGWFLTGIYFYVLCAAFPVHVKFSYVLLVLPVIMIVRLFPFTINALGPTEIAVAYLFGLAGISSSLAIVISLSSNIVSFILPGSIGFLVILFSRTMKGGNEC